MFQSTARFRPLRICEKRRILVSMKESSIMVRCRRPDLQTSYAHFCLLMGGLQILYLNLDGQGRAQSAAHTELLPFDEFPEARQLHDGKGWNVSELGCWVKYAESVVE